MHSKSYLLLSSSYQWDPFGHMNNLLKYIYENFTEHGASIQTQVVELARLQKVQPQVQLLPTLPELSSWLA